MKIVKNSEKDLIDYAGTVCEQSPQIRFDVIYKTKAQLGVRTALQKTPNLGTQNILLQNLYDEKYQDFQNFITWLKFIFNL